MIKKTSLDDFYKRNGEPLPDRIAREIGHFLCDKSRRLRTDAGGGEGWGGGKNGRFCERPLLMASKQPSLRGFTLASPTFV